MEDDEMFDFGDIEEGEEEGEGEEAEEAGEEAGEEEAATKDEL